MMLFIQRGFVWICRTGLHALVDGTSSTSQVAQSVTFSIMTKRGEHCILSGAYYDRTVDKRGCFRGLVVVFDNLTLQMPHRVFEGYVVRGLSLFKLSLTTQ